MIHLYARFHQNLFKGTKFYNYSINMNALYFFIFNHGYLFFSRPLKIYFKSICPGEHANRRAEIRCSQRASLAPAVPRAEGGLVAVGADAGAGVGRGPAAQRAHRQGRGVRGAGRNGSRGVLETGHIIS